MRNFLKLAEGIPVQPLLLAVMRSPDLWDAHRFRSDFDGSPHAAAETILLRCQPLDGSIADPRESIWYDASSRLPEARQLIMALMAQVQGERLGRAMLTRLPPGRSILPHSDVGEHPLQYERIRYWGRYHVPLQTDPAALFRCEDEVVHMAAGEAWWFNNALEHEVFWQGEGQAERIHLIIDVHSANEPVV